MSKELSSLSFTSILPNSIASDPAMVNAAKVLDAQFAMLETARVGLTFYDKIDAMIEPMLTYLATQWHVDFWDASLPLAKKRALLKMSYEWHEYKGTPAAVERILNDVLGGGYVEEWGEYDGCPKHFRVLSQDAPDNVAIYNQLVAGIMAAKNERSILDAIIQSTPIFGDISEGGVAVVSCCANIKYDEEDE